MGTLDVLCNYHFPPHTLLLREVIEAIVTTPAHFDKNLNEWIDFTVFMCVYSEILLRLTIQPFHLNVIICNGLSDEIYEISAGYYFREL